MSSTQTIGQPTGDRAVLVVRRQLPAEVRLDHSRVALHVGGHAGGDHLPEVEDMDVVAELHNEPHVMFDEEDRQLELVPDLPDQAAELLHVPYVAPFQKPD